jgi:hypothetical protein
MEKLKKESYQKQNSRVIAGVELSKYKTCARTTLSIQNMYMSSTTVTIQNVHRYHSHNTKHVHVPLSQYKTCICTVPLSQYKTCTRTTVTKQTCTRTIITKQSIYTYHCHNKICTHFTRFCKY